MSTTDTKPKAPGTDKTKKDSFDFETMAVVLCAMLESGGKLGNHQYEMMAMLDGKRTASSFEHQFRAAKARAKKLHEESKGGDGATPAKKTKGAGKAATPAGKGTKRGRKAKTEKEKQSDNEEESPSKHVKLEEERDLQDFQDGDTLF